MRQAWNQPDPQWPCDGTALRAFAHRKLGNAARDVRSVIYPYGGTDFIYPDSIFPNLERIVLIAPEAIGRLASGGQAAAVQRATFALRGCGTRSSYGITRDMGREEAGLGRATLLAVTVASRGHRIDSIDNVVLDANGNFQSGGPGIPAVRVSYTKAGANIRGEAIYVQAMIPDGLGQNIGNLVRQGFDGAFFKATMYVAHSARATNERILENVRYVVQSDDGIRLAQFNTSQWRVTLFGAYAAPSTSLWPGGWTTQPELHEAYAGAICRSNDPDREFGMGAHSAMWGGRYSLRNCGQYSDRGTEWGGLLRDERGALFKYSYSAASGPAGSYGGVDLKLLSSNLIYAERR